MGLQGSSRLVRHPVQVVALHKFGKQGIGLVALGLQELRKRLVACFFQGHLPVAQGPVYAGPILPTAGVVHLNRQFAEGLLVLGFGLRRCQFVSGNQLDQGGQHLAGMDGLEQVVRNLGANGFLHNAVFLAFGDHHHRQRRASGLYFGQQFQSSPAGHVLVQQNRVKALVQNPLQGIGGVVGSGHHHSTGFQKQAVRLQ